MKGLVDFLCKYEPSYQNIIEGYTQEEIYKYERLLGKDLPEVYRDFLGTVAANIGFKTYPANFNLFDVMELAREKLETLPHNLYPIAEGMGSNTEDFYLDLSASNSSDVSVVSIDSSDYNKFDGTKLYNSFRDSLFWLGFKNVRMLLTPHQYTVVCSEVYDSKNQRPLESIQLILESLNFECLGVTTLGMGLFDREDAAVAIMQKPSRPYYTLTMGAKTKHESKQNVEVVIDNSGGSLKILKYNNLT